MKNCVDFWNLRRYVIQLRWRYSRQNVLQKPNPMFCSMFVRTGPHHMCQPSAQFDDLARQNALPGATPTFGDRATSRSSSCANDGTFFR